ncbi:hypothetical protein FHS18_004856 [Paenibacillus phyllosphaerae]|uniref:Uncharacterized protein n=1 Tax=Paenibacillus phyllosphaerae TaxID=274593 RepID=A0A7W5FQ80_9BACL|nr:hypothetical protein [Paenibacillus phyllosphaerae]MBB3112754.1 hypothetical protein [Paenibacillus phyllosphaerae]
MRVSVFLEQKSYKISEWEDAPPLVRSLMERAVITVQPGHNRNHAVIQLHYGQSGSIRFLVRDLHQERSPLLQPMEESVIKDYDQEGFDYWDRIPPFGVVELYKIELTYGTQVSTEELEWMFRLSTNFLIEQFMMFVFAERTAANVAPYMKLALSYNARQFTYQGECYYRDKSF